MSIHAEEMAKMPNTTNAFENPEEMASFVNLNWVAEKHTSGELDSFFDLYIAVLNESIVTTGACPELLIGEASDKDKVEKNRIVIYYSFTMLTEVAVSEKSQ